MLSRAKKAVAGARTAVLGGGVDLICRFRKKRGNSNRKYPRVHARPCSRCFIHVVPQPSPQVFEADALLCGLWGSGRLGITTRAQVESWVVGGGVPTYETGGKEMRREREGGGANKSLVVAVCFLGEGVRRLLSVSSYLGRRPGRRWKPLLWAPAREPRESHRKDFWAVESCLQGRIWGIDGKAVSSELAESVVDAASESMVDGTDPGVQADGR